jgi:Uma2 family endonuclease
VVDLHREVVEVYRKPSREGYLEVQRVRKDQSLSVEAFPDLSLSVDETLT